MRVYQKWKMRVYSKQWYSYRAYYIDINLFNIECLFFLCIKLMAYCVDLNTYGILCRSEYKWQAPVPINLNVNMIYAHSTAYFVLKYENFFLI